MPNDTECQSLREAIRHVEANVKGQISEIREDLAEHSQAFGAHVEHYKSHEAAEAKFRDAYIESQTLNTQAITKLSESTEGLIQA